MALRRKKAWIAISAAGVLALVSVADARGFRRYLRLQRDAADLELRNRQLREQNARLRGEIEALRGDRSALEQAVREELGYVGRGEIVINLE
jgi:cell division protein FtsB